MKNYEALSKKHFDAQAREYDARDTAYYSKYPKISCKDVAERLRSVSYEKLLDVGCGTGYLFELLRSQREAQYHGLDLSPEMLKMAEAKFGSRVTLVEGAADRLPYAENSFDVVTCIQSFHHYPDPDKAMQEAFRVLKPGGLYILSDTGVGGIGGWIDNHILFPLMKSGDHHTENRHGIARRMEKNGFTVLEKQQVKGFIYTVIGRKKA